MHVGKIALIRLESVFLSCFKLKLFHAGTGI